MLRPKKKITKKDIKHDAMLETLYKAQKYYDANVKKVKFGGRIGIALIAGILIFTSVNKAANKEAHKLLTRGIFSFQLNTFEDSINEFELLLDEYTSTLSADEAYFYLGKSYLALKDTVRGEENIQHYLQKGINPRLEASGYDLLAKIEEDRGNLQKSAEYYLTASNIINDDYYKGQYKLYAAEVLIKTNNFSEAAAILAQFDIKKNVFSAVTDKVKELKSYIEFSDTKLK